MLPVICWPRSSLLTAQRRNFFACTHPLEIGNENNYMKLVCSCTFLFHLFALRCVRRDFRCIILALGCSLWQGISGLEHCFHGTILSSNVLSYPQNYLKLTNLCSILSPVSGERLLYAKLSNFIRFKVLTALWRCQYWRSGLWCRVNLLSVLLSSEMLESTRCRSADHRYHLNLKKHFPQRKCVLWSEMIVLSRVLSAEITYWHFPLLRFIFQSVIFEKVHQLSVRWSLKYDACFSVQPSLKPCAR